MKMMNWKFWQKRKMSRGLLTVIAGTALTVGVAGCGATNSATGSSNGSTTGSNTAQTTASSTGTVVIGGKNFTEQDIMADMMELLIQHDTKLHVKMKTWLDSSVVWNAEKNNNIDIYVEYTGTGLVNILHDPVQTDPQKVYDAVKTQFEQKYHVTWLKPIGFNNTYAMAMTKKEASKLGITTISDLAKQSPNLVLGTEQDFIARADALPAMNKLYGTKFKQVKAMEIGLKYKALVSGSVDAIDAFSTDGNIPANSLVLLKDNKHLFPPYYAAPIIRDSVLKAHPELKTVLNKLAGKIDDTEMQKLNAQVDLQHKKAMDVAKAWLQQNNLI